MAKLSLLNLAQLERAVAIKTQIEALEREMESLDAIANSNIPAKRGRKPMVHVAVAEMITPKAKKKRKMSPAARALIAAAQRARWAKVKGTADVTDSPEAEVAAEEPKKKRKVSRAAKAKMAASQKARWEKVRAEKALTA